MNDGEPRDALTNKVKPYGGWCYVSIDDNLVCDIPKIMTKGEAIL